MSKYPAQIDNTITLPLVDDNLTPVEGKTVNRLRSAIIATEAELGIKPSGAYTTVRARLDALDATIQSIISNGLHGDVLGLFNSTRIIGLGGRPFSDQQPNFNDGIVWNGIAWIPQAVSGSSVVIEGSLATDIIFTAGEFDTTLNDPAANRCGVKSIDMSKFPATIGALTRRVRFRVALENVLDSATYYAKAHLYDLTHSVVVTGTDLNNSGETDRGVVNEFESANLTVGSSSGNIRSDAVTLYAVRFSGNGIVDPNTERAILSGAHIEIRYI